MSSEAPSASWHPAMMPHRDADIVTKPKIIDLPAPPSPSQEASEAVQTAPTAARNLLDSSNQSSGADEWFPDYEASSPWTKEKDQAQLQEEETIVQHLEAEPVESIATQEQDSEQRLATVAQEDEPGSLPEPDVSQASEEATQTGATANPAQTETPHETDTVVAQEEQELSGRDAVTEPAADITPTQDDLMEEEQAQEKYVETAPAVDIQPAHGEKVEAVEAKEKDPETAPAADIQPLQEAEEEESRPEVTDDAPAPFDQLPQEEVAAEEDAQVPSGPTHISKDSFARTVSEQPNLEDDEDETPWSLPRADTDLFKFMPPNSRTNSFPVVPNLDHQQSHGHVRQLSTVQAEDIVGYRNV